MAGPATRSVEIAGDDHSKHPGLSVQQLSRFLQDIDYQPSWRPRADVDADYYDSNQYDAQTLADMEAKGIPPIVVNLIQPTVNLILGMEAKVRQDWVVRADDESKVDFSRAMTAELQKAERMTHADRACSAAYSGQVKAGLHWVHVGRQRMNPFGYPLIVEPVHRREIWWDWQDTSPDLSRARWLVRRKWQDFDVLKHWFPKHAKLVDEVEGGWSMFEGRAETETGMALYQDWLAERNFEWDTETWRNLERKQAMLYEVWYRVPKWTYVLTFENGFKTEFDRKNPVHVMALAHNMGTVDFTTMLKVRQSYWIGPHRLVDRPSPYPHDNFPYVPFWGYREDRTDVPYGHIRAMRPLQDEVNQRRARMLWQLSARRILGWDDAVKDQRAVEEEAARPDAAIWLDAKKRGQYRSVDQAIKIEDHSGMNAQQMEAYRDAAERLQDVASVFKEQLGKAGAADSGIAISQLIEQGTTALAELNENYTFARRLVGEQLLALVKEDLGDKPRRVKVSLGGTSRLKSVMLNEQRQDEFSGKTYRNNDVMMTRAHVALDNVPASASFRQHQFKELAEIVKKLPEQLQAQMLDMVVEASDAPYKEEMVRRIREMLGIQDTDPAEMSPEEREAYEKRAEAEELVAQLEKLAQEYEVRKLGAEADKTEAEAEHTRAETEHTEAETDKVEVETERLVHEPIGESGQEQDQSGWRIPGVIEQPEADAVV